MSEPAQQGIQLSHGIAAGIGAAFLALVRVGWGALQKSNTAVVDGLREQIATLREQLAVERAEKARLQGVVEKLGAEKDEFRNQLESERIKAAGVAYRIRQDPNIDDSFAEEMPTAVRERAALMAPQSVPPGHRRDPHPELQHFDPYESTPPKLKPPRPHQK